MEVSKKQSLLKDILGVVVFLGLVFLGYLFINNFIFRSFNVEGPSMETTMYTGDKLIVNKLPVSSSALVGKTYTPGRGQVIVFENPNFNGAGVDEFIVKRVIAFGGERVVVTNGTLKVYNKDHPEGFNPDSLTDDKEGTPISGDVDRTVSKDELFVVGDHRQDNFSLDSRNGLGTVPLKNIVGPVGLRIFPFQNFRNF